MKPTAYKREDGALVSVFGRPAGMWRAGVVKRIGSPIEFAGDALPPRRSLEAAQADLDRLAAERGWVPLGRANGPQ